MNHEYLRKYTRQNFDENGNTLMHKAVKDEDLSLLYKVAQMESNVNKQNKDGYSALHYAVKRENIEVIEAVLQCGVDPNLKTKMGKTARELALLNNRENILTLLDQYSPGLQQSLIQKNTKQILHLLKLWVALDNVLRSFMNSEDAQVDWEFVKLLQLDYYVKSNQFIHAIASNDIHEATLLYKSAPQSIKQALNSSHPITGHSVLSLAIRNHNNQLVRFLLSNSANTSLRLVNLNGPINCLPLTHYCVDKSAPFLCLISLLESSQTNQIIWHMKDSQSRSVLFLLAQDPEFSYVHLNKLLKITKCKLLTDIDEQNRNFLDLCRDIQRQDLVEACEEALIELSLEKSGRNHLLAIAIHLAAIPILQMNEGCQEIFQKLCLPEEIDRHIQRYSQFIKNIDKLQYEAEMLLQAIKEDNLPAVKVHNIANFVYKNGRTALHEAILLNRYKIAHWLVTERPGLVQIPDKNNRYALHYAYGVASTYGKNYIDLLVSDYEADDVLLKLCDKNNITPNQMGRLEELEEITSSI